MCIHTHAAMIEDIEKRNKSNNHKEANMPRKKGSKNISKHKKAEMLAQKNTGLYSNSVIAKRAGVSLTTVEHLSCGSVPAEVIEISKWYEKRYITYAQANAMKAQEVAFEKIHELNAKDATIVAEKTVNMLKVYNGVNR